MIQISIVIYLLDYFSPGGVAANNVGHKVTKNIRLRIFYNL